MEPHDAASVVVLLTLSPEDALLGACGPREQCEPFAHETCGTATGRRLRHPT